MNETNAGDALYRQVFDGLNCSVIVTDAEGVIEAWSGGAAALFGYTKQDALGRSFDFLFANKDAAAALLWKTKGGQNRNFPAECVTKAGIALQVAFIGGIDASIPGERHVFSLADAGAELRMRATVREKQQEENQLFAAFSVALPVIIWQTDAAGIILREAGEGLALFGRNPGDGIGKSVFDLYKGNPVVEGATRRALSGEFVKEQMEFRGHILEGILAPYRNERGDIMGIVGISLDITDRIMSDRRGNEVEARLDAIFNAQAYGLVISSPDMKIVDVNSALLKMVGYSRAELVGRETGMIQVVEANAEARAYLIDFMKTHDQSPPTEIELLHKDGSSFPVEVTVAVVRDAKGEAQYFVSTLRDIAKEKLSEAELHRLDQLKSKFIQVVAHQCRTPMNAIRWHLETLLAEEIGPLNDAQQNFIRLMHEKSTDVIDLIGDLITSIDIEEGRMNIETERISLDQLVSSVMNQYRTKCEARGIACLYQEPEASLPPVDADAAKIRKAIVKLVENAVNYTPRGGVVQVATSITREMIKIEVKDSGIGIPKTEQPGIFTRFFRASNASLVVTDGSGLGLYVAKHFVERHGGKIGFKSEEGKGSVFWIELPLAKLY